MANGEPGENAVLGGQQKQQNVRAGHVIKVVAAVKDYSQLSLRRTPSGPASAVRLREVSGL